MNTDGVVPARHAGLILELQRLGLVARFRRWAMGDTIVVAAATHESEDGIDVLIRSVCLYPSDSDTWIIDISFIGGRSESPPISEAVICDEVRRIVATDDVYWATQKRWSHS